MADGRLQGGDWALLGFYYQMIVELGLGTLNNEPLKADYDDTRLLVTTFAPSEERSFGFEEAGQDISIAAGAKRLLCQAKHSSNPLENTFDQSSFREVLASFAHSLEHVDKQNGPTVHGCILLTNRFPHKTIAPIKAIIQQCRTALGWQTDRANELPVDSSELAQIAVSFQKGRRPYTGNLKGLVEQWLTDFDSKGNGKKTSEAKTIEYALRVLPGFYFVTEAHISEFEQAFTNFARKYGAQDNEIDDAINQLLGRLIRNIHVKKDLTLRDFVKAVTKHENAQELTPTGIGGACVDAWKDWRKDRVANEEWVVPRQDLHTEFDDAVNSGKRIVFLLGEGGCGKTQLLAQLTKPKIELLSKGQNPDGFVVLKSCSEIKEDWLQRSIGEWANRGKAPEQCLDNPFTRLSDANPTLKYLLWVGLDGLDEYIPSQSVIQELVEVTRKRSDVCLIMTMRGNGYPDIYHILHPQSVMPPSMPDEDVAEIKVGKLEREELRVAVFNGTGVDIRQYIDWEADTSDRMFTVTSAFIASSRFQPIISSNDNFIQSLRHPRLLGAFVYADEKKRGTAKAALEGDVHALNDVAFAFLWQFSAKYKHRRQAKDLPHQEAFASLLQEVAKDTQNDQGIATKYNSQE